MSDLGSHFNDLPFWALKLQCSADHRRQRAAAASGNRAGLDAGHLRVRRARRPAAGPHDLVPGREQAGDLDAARASRNGATGICSSATRACCCRTTASTQLLPETEFADFQPPEPTLPRVASHHAEWLEACKNGTQSSANFEYAGWLTEANHLGNVAYRVGKKLAVGSRPAEGDQRPRSRSADSCAVSAGMGVVRMV